MSIFFSRLLSIVLHPLLMVTYCLILLISLKPFEFGATGLTDRTSVILLLGVFFSTFLLPSIGVLLMKPLGFIKSFEMEEREERYLPYIITGIFYLWVVKNLLGSWAISSLFTQLALGATIGLFLTFFANIWIKVSAHAAGVGGMVGAIFAIMHTWGEGALAVPFFGDVLSLSLNTLLIITIIMAGLVGSARLLLKAHSLDQIYLGYAIGLAAQMIASFFIS